MNQYILLSFDVEEFDLPLEYQQSIPLNEQLHIGNFGVQALTTILNNQDIRSTLFTTATYAINFPETIRQLAQQHEIASHAYYHSSFDNVHLLQSKEALEAITGKKVTGLRMPRMRHVEMSEILKAGYGYDSSINPTWLPGRYNNTHLPRTKYTQEGVTRIPASVSPNLRIPLFWLSFKNFPYFFFKKLVINTLKKDGYVCLYFHPWEFTNAINAFSLPNFMKKDAGEILVEKLEKLIKEIASEGSFISIQEWLSLFNK